MFLIIGAICGTVALIIIIILSICLCRKCKRRDPLPPPPVAVPDVFIDNDYQDPALAIMKKKEAAMSFDNPGYAEKADPPPSYSRAAGSSSPHPYCQLQPPSYEETKSNSYEEINDVKKDVGADYDNNPVNVRGNVRRILENFEKTTEKLEKKPSTTSKSSDVSDRGYDNVINEIKARESA